MRPNEFVTKLAAIGAQFEDRIDKSEIENALEWADHREYALAFGLFLELVYELELPVTAAELAQLTWLAEVYRPDGSVSVADLRKQVGVGPGSSDV